MTAPAETAGRRGALELSGAEIAWGAATVLFLAVHIAGLLSIPVGGVELDHLAGAWQAHIGLEDQRFVPTLFQAVSAETFDFTRSETLARALALLGTATIPFWLWRLRTVIGEAAGIFVLVLLAFDGPSILLGSTASALAWDIPIGLAALSFVAEGRRSPWPPAVLAFLCASAGAAVLPLVVALGLLTVARQRYPSRETLGAMAAGVAIAVAASSLGFGFGWEGLTIAPIHTFVQGFERDWAHESTATLAAIYSAPLLVSGLAAGAWRAYVCWREDDWPEIDLRLLTWGAVAFAWLAASPGSRDPVPLAAAAVPAALLVARELPALIARLAGVTWLYAAPALAGAFITAFIAEAYVVDWARIDRTGGSGEQVIAWGLFLAALGCLGLAASRRDTAPALLIPAAALFALWAVPGAAAVAFGSQQEPLPSPITSHQGPELRDIALAARDETGGLIVVHPLFEEAMTWPFRDSGEITLSSQVPPNAAILIWPETATAPDGYNVLEGRWSLLEIRNGPDGGFLDYLRWLSNRNVLGNTEVPIAVYLKDTP